MTTEIVIMNKDAIAIAADSASTIGSKIYTTNKVFMLSKYCPISIMIYGNAEIMDVPWEPIIKLFREEISEEPAYNNLEDYAHRLMEYLDNNTSYFFPESHQKAWFRKLVNSHFSKIKADFDRRIGIIENAGINISEDIPNIQIRSCIKKHLEKLEYEVNLLWEKGSRIDIIMVTGPYFEIFDKLLKKVFKDIELDKKSKSMLERVAAMTFYHNATGIVIAGFGVEDLFPVVVSYGVGGSIENRLMYQKLDESKISFNKPADIIPFAQSDVIETYLNGIAPAVDVFLQKEVIPSILESRVDGFVDYVFNDLKEELGDKECLENLQNNYNDLKEEVKSIVNKLQNNAMEYIVKKNREPIETAIEFLPKDELAIMAESLLTITALKRKYSIYSLESVGGDIDVAVISKSDGFVWIKRKHYFNEKINHHFFHNYFNGPNEDEE